MTEKKDRDIKLNDNRRQTISRVWAGGSTMGRNFDKKKLDRSKILGSELKIGTVVGGAFKIESVIGRGGMGVVYKASQVALGRVCALKVLSPELVNATNWKRFQNEAKVMAGLNHPCLIQIYDLGIHDASLPFYAMDYLQGKDLESMIRQSGPIPMTQAIEIFIKALDGFGYAHRNGIIHRDIKPGNIFLCNDPSGELTVKLLDFGILKLTDPGSDAQSMTATGEVFGSPFYMSPEQCMGEQVDARSDIYSIGCSLYEVLTGVVPFDGETPLDTVMLHIENEPPTLKHNSRKTFPQTIESVIARCLAKDPAKRYQNARELSVDLERIKQGKEPLAPPLAPQKQLKPARKPDSEKQLNGTLILVIGAGTGLILIVILIVCLLLGPGHSSPHSVDTYLRTLDGSRNSDGDGGGSTNAGSGSDPISLSAHSALNEFKRDKRTDQTTYQALVYNGKTYAQDATADDAPGMRAFLFPNDYQMGTINYCQDLVALDEFPAQVKAAQQERLDNGYAAKGKLLLRKDAPLEFFLTPLTTDCEVLNGFKSNDLYKLSLQKVDLSSANALTPIEKLTGLRSLYIHSCDLNPAALSSIDKLTRLKSLDISEDNISNGALAKLKILDKLTYLLTKADPALGTLLDRLTGHNSLKMLVIDGQPTATDIQKLSQFKGLQTLAIVRATVNKQILDALGKLSLQTLELRYCSTESGDFKPYSALTRVKTLSLYRPEGLHQSSSKFIQKMLPQTSVRFVGKNDD